MSTKQLGRRSFLQIVGGGALAALLTSCQPKVVEKVVKETVEVENLVKETVEVERVVEVTAPPPEPTKAAERVTLQCLGTLNVAILPQFTQATGIDVEDIPIVGDVYEKKASMFAAGDPPDVFRTSDADWCTDYEVSKLHHLIIDEYLERDAAEVDFEDIYPSMSKWMKMPDGHYYFMPFYTNSNVMAFNMEIFDQGGVPYPTADWTWDDLLQAAKELTIRDSSGMVTQWGKGSCFGWWGEFFYYQRQAGLEDWLSPDGKTVYMDTPEAIEGLQFFIDCIVKHKVSEDPNTSLEGGFAGGGYAMQNFIHTASWPGFTEAGLKWDIVLPPIGNRREGGELALDSSAIGKGSKHYEESWTYLKYISGKAGGTFWVHNGYPPIRKSVAQETWLPHKGTPDYPVHSEIYFDSLPYSMPVLWPPGSFGAWQLLQMKVDLMVEGKLGVEEGCKEAANEVRELIAAGT